MTQIYKHAHFLPDAFGHGGNRRTAQINNLLRSAGIDFQDTDFSVFAPAAKNPIHYLKGAGYSKSIKGGLKNTYAVGRYLTLFENFISRNSPELFIWESTVEHYLPLAHLLSRSNIPVIALPHNIESLVSNSKSVFSGKRSPQWLPEEIRFLSYCNKVFTISREEQWLLANMGIEAGYLPYYPVTEAESVLLDIRQKRELLNKTHGSHKNILLLGTFHNQPTYGGYTEVINQLSGLQNVQINVAGYGSEQLRQQFNQANLKIWGTVNNDELATLLIGTDFTIVHQQPSSGALTRIPEMLLAGINILANTHAARSYYNLPGVTVYSSFAELTELIAKYNFSIPPPIDRPTINEQHFIDCINNLIKHADR